MFYYCSPCCVVCSLGPEFVSHLSELLQVELQRLHIHVEAQCGHGEQDVLPVDGLPLLLVAALARLGRDEADEFADTLLHTLLGVFCNLRRRETHRNSLNVSFLIEDLQSRKPALFTAIFICKQSSACLC